MAYKVIPGEEGVKFPFPEKTIVLSVETSQEDLKKVYEHPWGPRFVSEESEPKQPKAALAPKTGEAA